MKPLVQHVSPAVSSWEAAKEVLLICARSNVDGDILCSIPTTSRSRAHIEIFFCLRLFLLISLDRDEF